MWRHTSSLYRFNFKETGLIFRTSCLMGINWSIFHSEHSLQKLADPCHMFPQNALIPWLVGSQLSLICHFHTSFKTFPGPITYIEEQGWCTYWWEYLISSHHCGPGSNPGVNTACGLSLLLVLSFASRGYSSCTPVFPSSQKPSFSNFNSTRKSSGWIEEPLSRCATSKLLFIYILIYWKVSMFWRLFWLIISWTLTFMKLLGSRPGTNESFE